VVVSGVASKGTSDGTLNVNTRRGPNARKLGFTTTHVIKFKIFLFTSHLQDYKI